MASGYGCKRHKPTKKNGAPLVKKPNVFQKKPQGWLNIMGGGPSYGKHNDY